MSDFTAHSVKAFKETIIINSKESYEKFWSFKILQADMKYYDIHNHKCQSHKHST